MHQEQVADCQIARHHTYRFQLQRSILPMGSYLERATRFTTLSYQGKAVRRTTMESKLEGPRVFLPHSFFPVYNRFFRCVSSVAAGIANAPHLRL